MECIELNQKQPSSHSCTKLSETPVFPVSIVKDLNVKFSKISEAVSRRCPVKGVLKIKTLQISLKNIREAVFKLTKFQAESVQLY